MVGRIDGFVHHHKMRVLVVIAFICGCGQHGSKPKTLASLESNATPVSLAIVDGKLLIRLQREDGMTLVELDPVAATRRDIAPALPSGAVAAHNGKLYFAEYRGTVGTLDPSSGTYRVIKKLDHAIYSVAATDRGVLVGAQQKVIAIDNAGNETDIAGAPIGAQLVEVDEVISTPLGAFATGRLADSVVRIDGDHAVVIADHQLKPQYLVAGANRVVWTTGDATDIGKQVVGVAPTGGTVTILAQAAADSHVQAVAADGKMIVCSMIGKTGSGIYVVGPDAAPRQVVETRASFVAISGTSIYWIEEADHGWVVKTTSL
jgi:hypothetical protein